jgi:hypothetical protein
MPGFVALAVIALSISYYVIHLALRLTATHYSAPSLSSSHYLWMLANCLISTGWDVTVAWFVLALQRNWKLRQLWTEIMGVMLGLIFIITSISHSLYGIFSMIKRNLF